MGRPSTAALFLLGHVEGMGYNRWLLNIRSEAANAEEPAMPPDPAFREMIGRLRAGDPSAAAELLKHYEPEVRRYIRVHLMSPRLHRFLDSGDIFQSVLAAFFVNVVDGQFDLEEPEQLIKLLVTMAHHKIVDYARKPDQRRAVERDAEDWHDLPAPGPRPSEVVARQELLERV